MGKQKITLGDLAFAIETVLAELDEDYENLEDFLDYCNGDSEAYVVIES
jgi:hypothetical protein